MSLFGPNIAKLKENRDFDGLQKALDHKKVEIRKEAANVLRELGGFDSVSGLLKALKDSDPGVRVYAVQGLAKIKDATVQTAITEAASADTNWEVQKEALTALVKSTGDIEQLMVAIQFNSAELREIAAMRLADVGGAKAVEALVIALKDEEDLVRLRAANALGKLKDPASLEPLKEAAKDKDPQVSKAARQALEVVARASSPQS